MIVRIRGGAVCTGTPITGTRYVVTAAHCVLDHDGHVSGARVVRRGGVVYTAVKLLIDTKYHTTPSPRLDVAVLVMDRVIQGPSASVAAVFPTQGPFALAGEQPLDTDGTLLRGTRYDNRPAPKGTVGRVGEIDTAAAGCVHPASDVEITTQPGDGPLRSDSGCIRRRAVRRGQRRTAAGRRPLDRRPRPLIQRRDTIGGNPPVVATTRRPTSTRSRTALINWSVREAHPDTRCRSRRSSWGSPICCW